MESLVIVVPATDSPPIAPLIEALGQDPATRLYRAFVGHIARTALAYRRSSLPSDTNRKVVFALENENDQAFAEELAAASEARVVVTGSAGAAPDYLGLMEGEFKRGARAVVVVTPEVPTLPGHIVDYAFRTLLFHDVAVGPTADGSPYLIGARRPVSAWFERQCASRAFSLGQIFDGNGQRPGDLCLLPFWYRVTGPEHLDTLRAHLRYLAGRDAEAVAAMTAVLENDA